ncbi:uncharacterized protein LOC126199080 [Schistocerca nitens]|uniref:uncharacterized protein LOC126199080 n=1 Tax=Schistocerca nitens TaxID=7011 RepID=UPI0021199B8B|nr:uncharacterized protein LOC126199080 [Schistocerca nitens]
MWSWKATRPHSASEESSRCRWRSSTGCHTRQRPGVELEGNSATLCLRREQPLEVAKQRRLPHEAAPRCGAGRQLGLAQLPKRAAAGGGEAAPAATRRSAPVWSWKVTRPHSASEESSRWRWRSSTGCHTRQRPNVELEGNSASLSFRREQPLEVAKQHWLPHEAASRCGAGRQLGLTQLPKRAAAGGGEAAPAATRGSAPVWSWKATRPHSASEESSCWRWRSRTGCHTRQRTGVELEGNSASLSFRREQLLEVAKQRRLPHEAAPRCGAGRQLGVTQLPKRAAALPKRAAAGGGEAAPAATRGSAPVWSWKATRPRSASEESSRWRWRSSTGCYTTQRPGVELEGNSASLSFRREQPLEVAKQHRLPHEAAPQCGALRQLGLTQLPKRAAAGGGEAAPAATRGSAPVWSWKATRPHSASEESSRWRCRSSAGCHTRQRPGVELEGNSASLSFRREQPLEVAKQRRLPHEAAPRCGAGRQLGLTQLPKRAAAGGGEAARAATRGSAVVWNWKATWPHSAPGDSSRWRWRSSTGCHTRQRPGVELEGNSASLSSEESSRWRWRSSAGCHARQRPGVELKGNSASLSFWREQPLEVEKQHRLPHKAAPRCGAGRQLGLTQFRREQPLEVAKQRQLIPSEENSRWRWRGSTGCHTRQCPGVELEGNSASLSVRREQPLKVTKKCRLPREAAPWCGTGRQLGLTQLPKKTAAGGCEAAPVATRGSAPVWSWKATRPHSASEESSRWRWRSSTGCHARQRPGEELKGKSASLSIWREQPLEVEEQHRLPHEAAPRCGAARQLGLTQFRRGQPLEVAKQRRLPREAVPRCGAGRQLGLTQLPKRAETGGGRAAPAAMRGSALVWSWKATRPHSAAEESRRWRWRSSTGCHMRQRTGVGLEGNSASLSFRREQPLDLAKQNRLPHEKAPRCGTGSFRREQPLELAKQLWLPHEAAPGVELEGNSASLSFRREQPLEVEEQHRLPHEAAPRCGAARQLGHTQFRRGQPLEVAKQRRLPREAAPRCGAGRQLGLTQLPKRAAAGGGEAAPAATRGSAPVWSWKATRPHSASEESSRCRWRSSTGCHTRQRPGVELEGNSATLSLRREQPLEVANQRRLPHEAAPRCGAGRQLGLAQLPKRAAAGGGEAAPAATRRSAPVWSWKVTRPHSASEESSRWRWRSSTGCHTRQRTNVELEGNSASLSFRREKPLEVAKQHWLPHEAASRCGAGRQLGLTQLPKRAAAGGGEAAPPATRGSVPVWSWKATRPHSASEESSCWRWRSSTGCHTRQRTGVEVEGNSASLSFRREQLLEVAKQRRLPHEAAPRCGAGRQLGLTQIPKRAAAVGGEAAPAATRGSAPVWS